MLDVQKDRLRHLVTSAILELWKKETGSTTSVLIQGTVCITARNGRTTVIQVTDRSPGVIPDDIEQGLDDKMEGITRLPDCTPEKRPGCNSFGSRSIDRFTADSRSEFAVRRLAVSSSKKKVSMKAGSKLRKAISSIHNHLGQQQLVQPREQPVQPRHMLSPSRDSNNNHSATMNTDILDNNNNGSLEDSDYEEDENRTSGYFNSTMEIVDVDNVTDENGKANENSSEDQNDSAIAEMSLNLSTMESNVGKDGFETPTKPQQREIGTPNGQNKEEIGQSVMDLSRRETDLLLSSPQSYTEQVREAIKRRLLSTVPSSMLPVRISPFGYVFPSAPSTPTSAAAFSASTAGLFQKPRDISYPCLPQNSVMNGWPTAANIAHSGPTSAASSQLDVRLLASPFTQNHMGFVSGSGMPLNMTQSPPMRQSLINHPQSLQNMLINGMPTTHYATSPIKPNSQVLSGKIESDMSEGHIDGNGEMKGLDNGDQGSTVGSGEQRVYRCDYCSKTFLFKSKYHEHLPVHTSARPFQCHLCSRTYKYKYDLRVHLRAHLGIPTKSTVCPFCAEKFGTNKLLRQHILDAHREQQAIGEDQCAKSLLNIAALAAARSTSSVTSDSNGCESNLSGCMKEERNFDDSSCSGDLKEDEDENSRDCGDFSELGNDHVDVGDETEENSASILSCTQTPTKSLLSCESSVSVGVL